MVLAVNQGVKFVNILPKHLPCKICHKNTQEELKNFGVDSLIADVHSHRNLLRNKKIIQESFHAHFVARLHQGESD